MGGFNSLGDFNANQIGPYACTGWYAEFISNRLLNAPSEICLVLNEIVGRYRVIGSVYLDYRFCVLVNYAWLCNPFNSVKSISISIACGAISAVAVLTAIVAFVAPAPAFVVILEYIFRFRHLSVSQNKIRLRQQTTPNYITDPPALQ